MTPARTGKGRGHFQFDRVFPDVGRVKCSSGTSVLREYHRRNAVLTKLHETAQLDVLRAFRDGVVSIEELVEHDRRGRGGESLDVLLTRRVFREAWRGALAKMGRRGSSRTRYQLSLRQLEERAGLATAPVAALRSLDWSGLRPLWRSPADWNRMRSAVSRFLSVFLGDKFAPFRRAVVAAIPRAAEPEGRLPELTPGQFVRVLARLEAPECAAAMCLVLTGARVGEYLGLDASSLSPASCRVRIRLEEGNKSAGYVTVTEADWPWIVAAVPFAGIPVPSPRPRTGSDRRYNRLRQAWARAVRGEGLDPRELTLHALRHCAAQWASDENVSSGAIGDLLRQQSSVMTRRYERQKSARVASGAVSAAITRAHGGRR